MSVCTKGFAYLLCWPRGRGIGLLVMNTEILRFMNFYNFLLFNFLILIFFFWRKNYFLTHDIQFTHTHDQHSHPHPRPTTSTHYPPPPTFSYTHLGHKREEAKPESRLLFFVACTKSGNQQRNETTEMNRNGRNKCNGRNDETKQLTWSNKRAGFTLLYVFIR